MHLIDATICNRKLHDLLMKCYSQPYTPNHYRINKTNPTKWNITATFCCISCSFEPNFSAYISFICADLRAPKHWKFCSVGCSQSRYGMLAPAGMENIYWIISVSSKTSSITLLLLPGIFAFFSVAIVFPLLIHCILLVASWRNYCCYLGALLFCEMFRLAALFHTLLPMFFPFLVTCHFRWISKQNRVRERRYTINLQSLLEDSDLQCELWADRVRELTVLPAAGSQGGK